MSRSLRRFRITDEDGLSALFQGASLPTEQEIVAHLNQHAVLLPPSITAQIVAETILNEFRQAKPFPTESVEISCWDIDEFRPYQDVDSKGVELPLIIDEDLIKARINSLLKEAASAGDWPGEDNDVFALCSLRGRELPVAIMLKGKSVRKPLRLRDAGVNGDQVLRLSESGAAIFIVQHIDKITEAVRRQLRMNMEALRARGHEAYCSFIDGVQTHKLMKEG